MKHLINNVATTDQYFKDTDNIYLMTIFSNRKTVRGYMKGRARTIFESDSASYNRVIDMCTDRYDDDIRLSLWDDFNEFAKWLMKQNRPERPKYLVVLNAKTMKVSFVSYRVDKVNEYITCLDTNEVMLAVSQYDGISLVASNLSGNY